ncbi:TetR family transcriptional regulator [Actinosynnema sp. ALI-1.44]|uniref:TetR/AcrR family transcriptional regulator n=1 Tax=Actinosynnema sp. ALI-1.44 TaxID=1933779 RepID=UPI00097BCE7C|nr:TetR family transcriptional regulator [Actinosynnema sp. ALI-1.44]ONI70627.1 TetR family transcriptional regulator [Actinosynnema sp. ALI-1.44]
MTTSAEQEGKRRGRRPAGADTKNALIEAARAVFIEQGYEGATVRAIAKRAGVDPAMVNHWFGGKEGLFGQSVLQLPIDPTMFANEISEGDIDTLGERIVRRFLTIWDSSGGGQFSALVRSVASHDMAVQGLREIFLKQIFMRVAAKTGADNAMFRATLVASQLVGMGMVRYVTKFEPLATNDIDTMVAAVGPTIQRYFTGDIG